MHRHHVRRPRRPIRDCQVAISIPVTVMTTLLSAIGAFALTRMRFAGRTVLSLILVRLRVIPPQVTLGPMLKFFGAVGLQGTVPSVWIYQVGITIPFGVFLVRGFMASLPEELFESTAVDGATTLRTFTAIVLPLSLPVLASLAIMQFLWFWNDPLIPLIFLGGSVLSSPLTVMTADMVQSTGQGETLMMAATFISILLTLIIVITIQRFFVRGGCDEGVRGGPVPTSGRLRHRQSEPGSCRPGVQWGEMQPNLPGPARL